MPELPEHLQDVFDRLEGDVGEARIELHLPKECQEAGATNPKECAKVMIENNAPEECRQALLDSNCDSERECRSICEEIMFKENAPEECVSAGLKDPKECGKLMFTQNAPQECIDAGITGENRNDPKKCQEIMEGLRGEERGFGDHGFGGNCREISDPQERLACYDGATSNVGQRQENFREDRREYQRKFAEDCSARQGRWECSGEDCRCFVDEFERRDEERFREEQRDDFREGEFREGEFEGEQREFEGGIEEGFDSGVDRESTRDDGSFESSGPESESSSTGGESSSAEGLDSAGSESVESSGGDAGITGGAVFDFSGNGFLDYFFK